MTDHHIKAVLWDFGGVLTASPFEAFAAYERDRGIPEGTIRRINATNPDCNAWARFERGQIDLDEFTVLFEAEAKALGTTLDAREVVSLLAGELRPDMVEALRRCHERLKTALLTNNFTTNLEQGSPGHQPLLDLFDVVVESSRAGCRKPDPRFYQIALDLLGILPEEAVFLDDLGVNLKPARQMGVTTIKVVDPSEALAELEELVGFPLNGSRTGSRTCPTRQD